MEAQSNVADHLQPEPEAVYDIPGFCAAHRISRPFFYQLIEQGKGPRLMRVNRRVLITKEAAADWRRAMERATGAGEKAEQPHAA